MNFSATGEGVRARRRTSVERVSLCGMLASATLVLQLGLLPVAQTGEGGTSHIMPGGNATLVDLPLTSPGGFFKPMGIHCGDDASAKVLTASCIVTNPERERQHLRARRGCGFETTILGGAHYAVAAFLTYT